MTFEAAHAKVPLKSAALGDFQVSQGGVETYLR